MKSASSLVFPGGLLVSIFIMSEASRASRSLSCSLLKRFLPADLTVANYKGL